MKIGVFSDLHLGNRQYSLQEREDDFYCQYLRAIDEFVNQEVDCVICAGDVFDKPRPSPRSLDFFIKGLKKLEQNDILFLNIIGNHSIVQFHNFIMADEVVGEIFDDSFYILLDRDCFYDNNDVLICGLPYHFKFELDKLVDKVSSLNNIAENSLAKFKILVLHQSFKEYNGFPGEEFSIKDIDISNFDLIICGHIHARVLAEMDKGIYLGAGSLERSSVAEAKDEENQGKGVYIIDTDNSNINFVRIRSDRKFFISDMYMNEENEIREIENEIRECVQECEEKPVLFLTVHDKSGSYIRLMDMVKSLSDVCLTVNFNYFDESRAVQEIVDINGDMPTPLEALKLALNPLDEDEFNLGIDLYNLLKDGEDAKKLLDEFLEKRKMERENRGNKYITDNDNLDEFIKYFEEK